MDLQGLTELHRSLFLYLPTRYQPALGDCCAGVAVVSAVLPHQGPEFNPRPRQNLYGKFRLSSAPSPLSCQLR